MLIVVSPYHLTTREPAAMAALLLADSCLTMLPTPAGGESRSDVEAAMATSPAYFHLLESWRWCEVLFREGVIGSMYAGQDAADDVRAAWHEIRHDDRYALLRPFLRDSLYDSERAYLGAVSRDVLRGGPDPGVCVPVAAGLDRFAARNALTVARAHPVSVAQQAEGAMAERIVGLSIPVLTQCTGERLLEAREMLLRPLDALRDAIDGVIEGEYATTEALEAGREYTNAFESIREELKRPDDEDDERVVISQVVLSFVTLPADAVVRSSVAAAQAVGGRAKAKSSMPTLPVLVGEADETTSMMVKVMGRPAR